MSKVRMDFHRNEIRSDTLRILDREFFMEVTKDITGKREDNEEETKNDGDGPSFAKLSERLA